MPESTTIDESLDRLEKAMDETLKTREIYFQALLDCKTVIEKAIVKALGTFQSEQKKTE